MTRQRTIKDKLSAQQIEKLDTLNFSWDPLTERWEEAFKVLSEFRKRKGHCRIPGNLVVDNLNIGTWVKTQRTSKDSLAPERVSRLNALGFSWDPASEQWESLFCALKDFHQKHGHCRVAAGSKVNGVKLGTWVNTQRYTRSELSEDRRKRLDSLGFIWEPTNELWEKGFQCLKKFADREGHCRVPVEFFESNFNLGRWAATQRTKRKILTRERINRLDSLGFTWDVLTDKWQERFELLLKFKKSYGNCEVPQSYTSEGIKLGWWVRVLRRDRSNLSKERINQLDSLGFNWDPINNKWENGYKALAAHVKSGGNCSIPATYMVNGFKLGLWVAHQRGAKEHLSKERRQRLDSLGFIWDPFTEKWEMGYKALINFKKREGHMDVKRGHIEDGVNLGVWISSQRKEKARLTSERIKKLNLIGFTLEPLDEKWSKHIAALSSFKSREGHCRVPVSHKEIGLNLGIWVSNNRRKKAALSEHRINQLNSMGFSWDPTNEKWEQSFMALTRFREREGHCTVPESHKENGLKLGLWLKRQRRYRDQLTIHQLRKLNSLGFK